MNAGWVLCSPCTCIPPILMVLKCQGCRVPRPALSLFLAATDVTPQSSEGHPHSVPYSLDMSKLQSPLLLLLLLLLLLPDRPFRSQTRLIGHKPKNQRTTPSETQLTGRPTSQRLNPQGLLR